MSTTVSLIPRSLVIFLRAAISNASSESLRRSSSALSRSRSGSEADRRKLEDAEEKDEDAGHESGVLADPYGGNDTYHPERAGKWV
jgi:hypothetical protein